MTLPVSVTSSFLPGIIPLLIPGERFNKSIVEYLRFARMFNEKFPGFDTDIHGLVEEIVDGKPEYFVDCVSIKEPTVAISTPKQVAKPTAV